jgi:hypothetical protein
MREIIHVNIGRGSAQPTHNRSLKAIFGKYLGYERLGKGTIEENVNEILKSTQVLNIIEDQ